MHPIDGRRYDEPATLICAVLSIEGHGYPAASGRPCSAADGALRFDVERIYGLARRHEQAVALDPAETDVGATLGQHDAADHLPVGGQDDNPILGLAARP